MRGLISFGAIVGGMIFLLSYSIKDSLLIKSLNLILGLATGGLLYAAGF